MALSAFNKENIRSIGSSLGRFLAIAAIVALGAGFYAGLNMTEPDMKLAADSYYDQTNLMDVRVVSTMGLTEDDLTDIEALPDVVGAMGSRELDVVADIRGDQYTARIHSLPDAAPRASLGDMAAIESGDEEYINRVELLEGTWPTRAGQCVISIDRIMNTELSVGDSVTLTEGSSDLEDTLITTEFTISGFVRASYYPSQTALGSTSLGTGTLQQYFYILDENFREDVPFTSIYVTAEGARDEMAGTQAYDDRVQEVVKELEGIESERADARLQEVREEGFRKLADSRAEFEEQSAQANAELNDAKAQLDEAKAQLDASEAQLAEAEARYNEGTSQLASSEIAVEAQFQQAQQQLDAQKAEAEKAAEQLPSLNSRLAELNKQIADPSLSEEQRQQLRGQAAYIQTAISEINEGQVKVIQAQQQLDAQKAQAESQLAATRAQLEDAKKQIDEGKEELEKGKAEYETNLADYTAARAEADEELADGKSELDKAQADLDALKAPEWLILDRTKNPGVVSFYSDAERIGAIGSIFPFIFFLVAALVALTTMTRMVDDDRVLIGTFKSLGFSRGRITSKYLVYAGLSSIGGAVIGIAVLSQVLPWVIMEAYSTVYSVPKGAMPVDWFYGLLAIGLGVGVTLLATCGAVLGTLRQPAAELLRPAAPPEGKRIFLEYIFPLWYRMSFTWKITCRNIFRYKKRLVMTIVGIAGCTALVVTGFGLQNSIHDIIAVQYGELVHYNTVVMTDEELSDAAGRDIRRILNEPYVNDYAFAQDRSVLVAKAGKTPSEASANTTLVVPQSPEDFDRLWTMRTRGSAEDISCTPGEVIVTEKLANLAGVAVGDRIEFALPDNMGNASGDTYSARVTAIMENYVGNYLFMGPAAYQACMGEEPSYRAIYATVSEEPRSREAFVASIRSIDDVKTVSFNDEVIESYETMLNSVNMVVVVLVVAAAMLAFVVLYNLANINIAERAREIATLKVLGFTKREVDSYIFREIFLLSILGALIGLVLGIFIEGFVVVTAEVDQVMFGRTIHWWSFVVSFLLTLVFTVIVTLFMRAKLDHIDMIESLKSNE